MNEPTEDIEYLAPDGTKKRLEFCYRIPMVAAANRGKTAKWCELRYYLDEQYSAYTVAVGFSDRSVGPKSVADRDTHTYTQCEWAYRDYFRWVAWYGRDPLRIIARQGTAPTYELRKYARAALQEMKRRWRRFRRNGHQRNGWTLEDEIEYQMIGRPWWYRAGRRLYAKWPGILPNGQIITMTYDHN